MRFALVFIAAGCLSCASVLGDDFTVQETRTSPSSTGGGCADNACDTCEACMAADACSAAAAACANDPNCAAYGQCLADPASYCGADCSCFDAATAQRYADYVACICSGCSSSCGCG